MDFAFEHQLHMWFALVVTIGAIISFIRERVPIEVTSLGLLTALLLFGQFFPIYNEEGKNLLDSYVLLSGFANPMLVAVLALLVMGQGMLHTDALKIITNFFKPTKAKFAWPTICGFFLMVTILSAFMNDTPLVVICIPLIQGMARKMNLSESKVLIPLSYAAILGGMTTLLGSSTNLLVSSAMTQLDFAPPGIFDFAIPGAMLAFVGFLYVVFVVPYLLKDRSSMAQELAGSKKEFVVELDVTPESKLVGLECSHGEFPALEGINVKLVQRGGQLLLPPFEGYKIEAGDILIVASTRDKLTDLLSKFPGFLLAEEDRHMIDHSHEDAEKYVVPQGKGENAHMLAEIMITPVSRFIDISLEHANFERQYGTIVLGIQRRAKVVRRRLGRIRLEAGDVLLIAGKRRSVNALRDISDFIVLSGSKEELPLTRKAPVAVAIFAATVGCAVTGILSITVAAITGAAAMIAFGCLNLHQATRAINRKIFLLVGSMLALGVLLEVSGAAATIAQAVLSLPIADNPLILLGVLFILISLTTNILTNNACAILFTPIAMNLAAGMPLPDDFAFDIYQVMAILVIFAANCSFASPIGYQTNLLVMGPGHYRFRDFFVAGAPLVLVLWITYILIAHFYYGF